MSPISKRIREARIRAWISQERLAIQAGIDPASARARMSRYERGARVPDPETLERIARVLT